MLNEQEIRTRTHAAIQSLGLAEVSRRLDIKPDMLARIACGALVKKGSLALVGQALPRLEAAAAPPLALSSVSLPRA
jgi:hypothetical protein